MTGMNLTTEDARVLLDALDARAVSLRAVATLERAQLHSVIARGFEADAERVERIAKTYRRLLPAAAGK